MEHEEERQARPGGQRLIGRPLSWAGGVFSVLCAAVILAGLGAYGRLNQGPIDLSRFLDEIELGLSQGLQGMRIDLGGAVVALDKETDRAVIELSDITLVDDVDGPFARAPKVTSAFSMSDLINGRIRPRDVVLTGISARLIRSEAGVFSFGFGGLGDTEAGDGDALFRRLLDSTTSGAGATDGAAAPGAGGQSLRLTDVSLLYLDRKSNRVWRAPDVDIRFRRTEIGVEASTEVKLIGGRYGDMTLSLQGYRAKDGDLYVSASVDNAAPLDVADQIGALDWLAAFDAPVDGAVNVAIDAEGGINALSGELSVAEGSIAFSETEIEAIDSAVLRFDFDPDSGRFLAEEIAIEAARVSFSGAGFVEVGRDDAGEPVDIVTQLDVGALEMRATDMFRGPLTYDEGRVTGRLTLEPLTFEIGEMRLQSGEFWFDTAGWMTLGDENAVTADLAIKGGGMTVWDLLDHWPFPAAPGAYDWMAENMIGADITDFDASIRLGAETGDDVKFDFSFENAAGHYLKPMPPIIDAVGAGQVDLKRFTLAVDAGRVVPENGQPLDIAGSTFVIEDLEHPDTPADVDLIVTGGLRDALRVLDSQPLGFVSRLGLPISEAKGRVAVRTAVSMPLLNDLLLEDVQASATADIRDLSLAAPQLGGAVASRRVALKADTKGFALNGVAQLSGFSAKVDWRETFATGARDIRLNAELTPEQIAKAGLDAPWFRSGAAKVAANVGFGEAGPEIALNLDLEGAGLSVNEIGWVKPEGRKADVTARLLVAEDAFRIPTYELTSRDLEVEGRARIAASGGLEAFKLRKLLYRGGADLAVTGNQKDGRWNLRVEGRSLDLTKFGDLLEGGDVGRNTALRIKVDINDLIFRPKLRLVGADGLFFVDEDSTVRGRLEGAMDGVAPFALRVKSGPNGGELAVKTANAGELMRAAGAFEDGAGGKLVLAAKIPATEDLRLEGTLRLTDIVIHEDAKLERLLIGADLDDLRNAMRKDGIAFDDVVAPFTFRDGEIRVKEAVAKSSSIGVNVSGAYGLESAQLDLNGVFTPFYALNSALGGIPILGALLTGGDGQGLFAFNFAVKGPAEDPSISVNPLSVLTPGVFRNIFSLEGTETAISLDLDDVEDGDR